MINRKIKAIKKKVKKLFFSIGLLSFFTNCSNKVFRANDYHFCLIKERSKQVVFLTDLRFKNRRTQDTLSFFFKDNEYLYAFSVDRFDSSVLLKKKNNVPSDSIELLIKNSYNPPFFRYYMNCNFKDGFKCINSCLISKSNLNSLHLRVHGLDSKFVNLKKNELENINSIEVIASESSPFNNSLSYNDTLVYIYRNDSLILKSRMCSPGGVVNVYRKSSIFILKRAMLNWK